MNCMCHEKVVFMVHGQYTSRVRRIAHHVTQLLQINKFKAFRSDNITNYANLMSMWALVLTVNYVTANNKLKYIVSLT